MIFSQEPTDKEMMGRCLELSRIAVQKGEYPFATIIALEGKIVAEAINRTVRDGDVTRHAEVIALSQAQKTVCRKDLRRYTLYSNVEPCAMCSFCIREAWIGRVVYALASPVMGGMSKWNILRDDSMSDRIPQIFGPVPQIVSGLLAREAQLAWQDWNPLAWHLIKRLGLLMDPCTDEGNACIHHGHRHSFWQTLQMCLERNSKTQAKGTTLNASNVDL